ncbi:MAG: hypothetical protein ABJB16_17745 [Saprospiraceae bacterium]
MKWILGLLIGISILSACSNELVVVDKWKDIPVVWGLLSKSDTAHYIRVEKAFLDPTTSAYDIALIPDSLYYDNAVVSLKRINNGQVFILQKVDGNLEGYPRADGIFASTPNYLYKIKNNVINLVIGEKYEFQLDKGDGSPLVTAHTVILPKPVLRNPSHEQLLQFKPKTLFTFNWNAIDDAGIFDLKMRFHYIEKSPETGNIYVPKSVEWTVESSIETNEFKIDGVDFYTALKADINENFEAIRRFDSIDIVLWCGGIELKDFVKIALANSGLTSTQDIPKYTNLSEGLGIFTSRNVSYNTGFKLTPQSLDSLKNGSVTKVLKFQ